MKLFKVELDKWQPRRVLILTGMAWADSFLGDLTVPENKCCAGISTCVSVTSGVVEMGGGMISYRLTAASSFSCSLRWRSIMSTKIAVQSKTQFTKVFKSIIEHAGDGDHACRIRAVNKLAAKAGRIRFQLKVGVAAKAA